MATGEAAVFDALFAELAEKFRAEDGWEARQEEPPQAYLHVSRPSWGDENLNGIHIETYVLSRQLAERRAPVALHCERGCPFQPKFMQLFTQRAAAEIKSWPGDYAILGDLKGSSSICEVSVPFAETPAKTVEKLKGEVQRLQKLACLIDETIADCTGR